MASVNKVILIGNLGADPESRYMPNGDAVSNFRIATTESWKDKATGEKKEATEWHSITVFRKLAEICNEYLLKGASVYIEGKLKTRKWTDKEGVERYTTYVEADNVRMLGGGKERNTSGNTGNQRGQQQTPPQRQQQSGQQGGKRAPSFEDMDDDIPF